MASVWGAGKKECRHRGLAEVTGIGVVSGQTKSSAIPLFHHVTVETSEESKNYEFDLDLPGSYKNML